MRDRWGREGGRESEAGEGGREGGEGGRRGREGVRDRWGRESEAGEGGREGGEGGGRGWREGGRERERLERRGCHIVPLLAGCHMDSPHCPRQQWDFFLEKKSLDSYLET